MVERADIVVVGAGLGGLAAAVTSAAAGRHTVVIEHHTLPGGYAQCFARGPYRFEASLHALNGLAVGGGMDALWRKLGIWDHVTLHRLDPLYAVRFPDRMVTAPADPHRYEAELLRHFPEVAGGIRSYLDDAFAISRDVARMRVDDGASGSLEDFVNRYPALVAASGETWAETILRHTTDPRLVAVLGALWGYAGLPPELLSSLVGTILATDYGWFGGWYPEGGSASVAFALEQVARQHGAEFQYGQTVTSIDVRDGRAVAVETADGLRVEAGTVISNASAPGTLEMIGRANVPADWIRRVDSPKPSYTTFSVYLGLDRDVFAALEMPHEVFVAPSYDTLASWNAALAGDWDHASLAVADYTHVDPGCAPAGGATVVVTAGVGWEYADVWGTGGDLRGFHDDPRYRSVKERVADELVRVADRAVPGLADAVDYREAATPLTNAEYTRNPHGAIEGYENTPANTGLGWLPQATPIANLFLAGAWTNTGGQNPAIASGYTAARLAMAREREERAATAA